ncbi:hypothetical protein CHS0354_034785 [Potamilus streckersoni]|uniref:Uncharacterized protein n=1 Tax=Potamilus streckersoni TaxID=2493646 RepID=A0AAE0RSZ8_9BIVA|nr:hypothetical protein CHS0354_034785 [Potamilus streckersoni]
MAGLEDYLKGLAIWSSLWIRHVVHYYLVVGTSNTYKEQKKNIQLSKDWHEHWQQTDRKTDR